jgi:uncharacterized protein YoxC
VSLPDCEMMLGPLAIPPRLLARALEDLHTVAGRLGELVESVRVLPRTEDELSANIALLREDVQQLNALLEPLTAALEPLPSEVAELRALLKRLPGI